MTAAQNQDISADDEEHHVTEEMTAPPPLSPPENVVTLEMESLPDDVMSVHVEEVSIRRPGQLSSEFVWIDETAYYIVLGFKTHDILGFTGIHSFHLSLRQP